MANIKRANASSITKSGVAIADVPDAPTIGAVTDLLSGSTASVAYTAAVTGGAATTFTATSSPGGFTGTGSSPITVSGLSSGTAYTFTVAASNSTGTSAASSASSSLTLASVGAYQSIATATAVSGTTALTFSSIPATYTHLQIRGICRDNGGAANQRNQRIRFNSDTGTNYAYHQLGGAGSSLSTYVAGYASRGYIEFGYYGGPDNSLAFRAFVIDINDYASTTKNKTVRALHGWGYTGGSGNPSVELDSGLWMSTAAISTVTITIDSGQQFEPGSTFALYGIKGS